MNNDPTPKKLELDEQDLYCIARLIQSAWFQNNLYFACCNFCRYGSPCVSEDRTNARLYPLMEKLGRLTGLDMSLLYDPLNPKEKFSYDEHNGSEIKPLCY